VHVVDRPEYAAVDGFALVPGRRAVIANWVRVGDVWSVDASCDRGRIRSYRDALGDSRAHDVMDGDEPQARLRALAAYLGIDWSWLTGRCRDLAAVGTAELIRPRSRLLTGAELDRALHLVGTYAP
jgi:hypothetical protein